MTSAYLLYRSTKTLSLAKFCFLYYGTVKRHRCFRYLSKVLLQLLDITVDAFEYKIIPGLLVSIIEIATHIPKFDK